MTQPVAVPEKSPRTRSIWIVAIAIGLMLGVALGVAISPLIIKPEEILCIINPVQVSGTVHGVPKGMISFVNDNEANSTRYSHHVPIANERYSIVLSGGQTYRVSVGMPGISSAVPYAPYYVSVPSNITTFTVNFT